MTVNATVADVLENRARWCIVEREALAGLLELPPASACALLTDPPYSSGGFTRADRTADPLGKYRKSNAVTEIPSFSGDNRDQHAYLTWITVWLAAAERVLETGAPVGLWTDWRQIAVTTDALQCGGMVWRGIGVWTKEEASRPQMSRYRNDAEFFVWGSNGPMPVREGVGVLPGVWACPPVPAATRVHLTEKPVRVMEEIVAIAPPGGVVLDPFAGSGSTGVACLRTGRRFIGFEKDPTYAQIARERLAAEEAQSTLQDARAGQTALFGGTGS